MLEKKQTKHIKIYDSNGWMKCDGDFVDVIRCKDCVHYLKRVVFYKQNDNPYIPNICTLYSTINHIHEVNDDDYCSRAEENKN